MMLSLIGELGTRRLLVWTLRLECVAQRVQDGRKHPSGQKDGQEESCPVS